MNWITTSTKFGEFIESRNKIQLKIDLIIPSYNEVERIGAVANALINLSRDRRLIQDLNLIFVDDGSTDETVKEIENCLDQKASNALLLKLNKNRGVGYAFLYALDSSNSDLVCLVPGDGVFDIDSLMSLLNSGQCDCVTLSVRTNRYLLNPIRRFCSKIFGEWFSWMTKSYVPDPHSLFLIPTRTAKTVVKEIWGELPLKTNFRLENDYHLLFLHNVLIENPVNNLVEIKVNQQFEKNSSVWNLLFLLRFGKICLFMTFKNFKFIKTIKENRSRRHTDQKRSDGKTHPNKN